MDNRPETGSVLPIRDCDGTELWWNDIVQVVNDGALDSGEKRRLVGWSEIWVMTEAIDGSEAPGVTRGSQRCNLRLVDRPADAAPITRPVDADGNEVDYASVVDVTIDGYGTMRRKVIGWTQDRIITEERGPMHCASAVVRAVSEQ